MPGERARDFRMRALCPVPSDDAECLEDPDHLSTWDAWNA